MNIRSCRPGDEPELLRMRAALWPEVAVDEHRVELQAWLCRSDGVLLVAPRSDGIRLAGFAEVGLRSVADSAETSPVCYLEGWYVDEDMRRRGIGATLVRAAEAWGRERGLREFASDAELENLAAQRAHEAVGFREVERSVLYLKKL